MATEIMETLPWIDYEDLFTKLEERGRAEGRIEREMEIALKAFSGRNNGRSSSEIISMLKGFGISDEVIESARKQTDADPV